MTRELSPWTEPPDDGDYDGLEAHWDRRIEQDGEYVVRRDVIDVRETSPEPD